MGELLTHRLVGIPLDEMGCAASPLLQDVAGCRAVARVRKPKSTRAMGLVRRDRDKSVTESRHSRVVAKLVKSCLRIKKWSNCA